ncbi:MAG: YbhN family protein [Bacteroidia bacterium]
MAEAPTQQDPLSNFKISRVIWPILIGIGVVVYLLYTDLSEYPGSFSDAIAEINWTGRVWFWLVMGLVMMVVRDVAYMWRMRILTEGEMSWKACFQVTLLWEFASAASPSIVGGAAVAVFMFIREKINPGKSTAIVFVTIFLDELFYILILPLVLIPLGHDTIFAPLQTADSPILGTSMVTAFWIAYSLIFAYVLLLAIGIFFIPNKVSRGIKRIFSSRYLRRFQRRMFNTANELQTAAEAFRGKSRQFWLKAWGSTVLAWLGRYLVLNCVLGAFSSGTGLGFWEHLVAFSRQAVLFVVMIVSPTPGSSGIAELGFKQLFAEFIPAGIVLTFAAIFWRFISYYPYLFVGLPILPGWLKRVYGKNKK